MKLKAFTYITMAAFLAACGATSEGEKSLEILEAERDSLRKEQREINTKLEDIEARLAELDTAQNLTEVTSLIANPTDFDHYFTVQASLEAKKNAQVYPETQGRVVNIFVSEGDQVTAGQSLIEIDSELIEKNIDEVQTNLDLAIDVFNRQKRLWEKNIGSEMQFLEAKNRKEQLEDRLATLQEQKQKSIVKAPFSGVVDNIVPKIGEMANPAMPVARVINLNEVYLTADISERYIGQVKKGDSVKVTFPGVDTLHSVISRIGNFINPANRSFEITVDIPKTAVTLKPNLIAEVKINNYHADSVLTVPSSIIQEDTKGRKFLYVVKDENGEAKVEKKIVSTGKSYEGQTVVISGIESGAEVVDKGSRQIVDGQPVNVIKDKEALVQQ